MPSLSPPYRGRFAPSPTGPLHFGSLVAACASYLDARAHDGQWLLRIDDLDQTRVRPGADNAILTTLERFGFRWDEEPIRQSDRTARYRWALARLTGQGLVYACNCSRKRIREAGLAGVEGPRYPGYCRTRGLADDGKVALRVAVPEETCCVEDAIQGRLCQALATDVGDFVVRRADGYFAYQLAVVMDDADQGINHVIRGADLFLSTPRQVWLQRRLGVATPRYAHVPLARDAHGRKLSKQDMARPVDAGDPLPALRAASDFLGQPPAVRSAPDLDAFWRRAIDHWSLDSVPATS
ncbi:MAG TPA: tRNA glutamyl-Q(34) synthetase GluQRS [Chromatiaceae bacterium]|nr:tRNA glutamyl-Q(34) synthetase GluQRS [Chromatiaceae bacterium]